MLFEPYGIIRGCVVLASRVSKDANRETLLHCERVQNDLPSPILHHNSHPLETQFDQREDVVEYGGVRLSTDEVAKIDVPFDRGSTWAKEIEVVSQACAPLLCIREGIWNH